MKKAKIPLFLGLFHVQYTVFWGKMSTYALLLSITLLVRTDKILCLAVNIILGLDKISLPECTEASLLKCPTFSPGTMGSTRAFAVHPCSVLFEGSHTGASFPLRHSLGSVMQRPHKTFISQSSK